jgi:hypothetical protein
MTGAELRQALRSAAAPGELDAERRAWGVVRAAYEGAEPVRRPRWRGRPVVALAAALALVAAALTPPGRAVTGWVREAVGLAPVEGREDARPLTELPARGRLLVVAGGSAWVVRDDGSKRRLGRYDAATWSPQGLHVALARGSTLVAATPEGTVRWTVTRGRRVVSPSWSPSGFRVAYGVGREVRVVHGDGEPDRRVARGAVPGSWAWLPDTGRNVLTYVTSAGAVRTLDVDSLETVRVVLPKGRPAFRRVAYSHDGERMAVASERAVTIFGGRAGALAGHSFAGRVRDVRFAPSRALLAVLVERQGRARVAVVAAEAGARPRTVFSGAGRFAGLEWSPDGRWLLVAWPSADQWVFLRMPGVGRIRAASAIGREFDPGGAGEPVRTRLSGWCCPPAAP